MSNIWTAKRVLDWAASDFKERGLESPRLEAEVLLSHVLSCTRLSLYTGFDRPLDGEELSGFKEVVRRRRRGEPSAYITGGKEFWSLMFAVTPDVLVPRPDTETLVERALELVGEDRRVLDLCTGSGCIAVAIAKECPGVTVDAIDMSPEACAVAGRNVFAHGLSERVRVICGDLFEPLEDGDRYSIIVSNPPYVIDQEIDGLSAEVRWEPKLALAGGPDGLDVVRKILGRASGYLKPGGSLLLEVDSRQTSRVAGDLGRELFGAEGVVVNDLSGRGRVVVFSGVRS